MAFNNGNGLGALLNALLRLWPVVVLIAGAYAFNIQLHYRLNQIEETRDSDLRQWVQIRDADNRLTRVEERITNRALFNDERTADLKRRVERLEQRVDRPPSGGPR